MNTRNKYRTLPATTPGNQAYKGYLIIRNPFTAEAYVRKDGHNICASLSVERAKREIDQLVA